MSKKQKCPHCGFEGYPEIARKEKTGKFFLASLLDLLLRRPLFHADRRGFSMHDPDHYLPTLRLSYSQWEHFSTDKHLRCARCKQPLFQEDFDRDMDFKD